MKNKMRLIHLMGLVGCLALTAACGKGGSEPEKPDTAGTAEQLAGTTWATSGGTLRFHPNGGMEFMPKASEDSKLPIPDRPLAGNYSVAEGVLRGSIANTMPIVGTWDGEILTIGGEECTRAPAS